MTPREREIIVAAFVEGYIQGAHHPKGVRILAKANELAALFVATIRERAPTPGHKPGCLIDSDGVCSCGALLSALDAMKADARPRDADGRPIPEPPYK